MRRRDLLRAGASLGIGSLLAAQRGGAADVEIELRPKEPGVVISKHLYGHFIEHLGGVIYDGIWVGPQSKVPNVAGIRKQFIDDMKRIGAPNLRWPGGCFADGYHWRDGIGPRDRRPRGYNYWQAEMPPGVHPPETNHFGTHEFMRLCREIGAEPYLAANMGSGSPREFHDWVTYCNAPAAAASLASERAANGDPEPFQVTYWGVGNESWGCGGNMLPQEYAPLYYKFTSQVPAYRPVYLVAVGPRGHSADMDLGWTTGFFQTIGRRRPPDGFALHFYSDFRRPEFKAGDFTPDQWHMVLHEGTRTEQVILAHWNEIGKYDTARRTRLVVDEWGTWYRPGATDLAPTFLLSQVGTLRDAVHAAITFDIFNRHGDKIAMANIAQTVNCLHSLFWAIEDKFVRTPTYYTFELYQPHMEGRLVPAAIHAPEMKIVRRNGESAALAMVAGSASVKDGRVTLTLTNASLDTAASVRIRLDGVQAREVRGRVLTHADMRAANTFERPAQVQPAALPAALKGGGVEAVIPSKSVAALEIRLV